MEEVIESINNTLAHLKSVHGEDFVLIYDNYFLSRNGTLYSYFRDRLRPVKPSYKVGRDGKIRPTLRISYRKVRRTYMMYRLTAQYFKEEFKDQDISHLQVNHLDGEVFNVDPDNLEFGDQENNCAHRDFKNHLYEHIDSNLISA